MLLATLRDYILLNAKKEIYAVRIRNVRTPFFKVSTGIPSLSSSKNKIH